MKWLRRIKSHPHFWPVVIVALIGLLAGAALIGPGYFNMHDDLQMMRQLEMEKCFLSLQIPCRWVPDMGYGFGFPLFNFYPPLPYLAGELVRLLGFPFVDTVKIIFIFAFVASGVTMYFLAKEFFGRLGGVVSAVFYIWAPYHAVDIYVRGALNEAWALIWFPLCLWAAYRLISEKKANFRWIVTLALALFALLTSHNLMAMIFSPIFGLWCLFWLARLRAWRKVIPLGISGLWGLGLALFFTLPVVLEQKYTHADSLVQGYYEYVAHFASTSQILFSRFWGYGPSVWGTVDDRMSFQIGHIHWILSLIVLAWVGYRYFRYKKFDNLSLILIFFFGAGWLAAFMVHSKSTPIWLRIPPLKYVQFPWRFLTLVIFAFSFLAGAIVYIFPKKLVKFVGIVFILMIIIFNRDYFLPEHGHLGPLTDQEKFSGAAWDLQQTAGIYDYLPKTAEIAPNGPQKSLADIVNGKGEIISPKQETNRASFNVNVATDYALVRVNIFQFPDWRVFIDGTQAQIKNGPDDRIGRIHVNVPKGMHQVYLKLYDTWPRTLGNIVSLVSWVLLIILVILRKKKLKNFRLSWLS